MKSFALTVAAAAALSLPIAAFAQTDATLTRAQVRAELQQLEQAGYSPGRGEDVNYPSDIQAAEARISNQNGASAYGGVVSGSSASGAMPVVTRPASPEEMKQIYFGGQ
jgi:type II secretory pathway pseudopilin PulG